MPINLEYVKVITIGSFIVLIGIGLYYAYKAVMKKRLMKKTDDGFNDEDEKNG